MGRQEELKELVRKFLELIGEDPNREGLRETPERVARMWLNELTAGYRDDPSKYLKKFGVGSYLKYGDTVVVVDVPVRSMCEHHLLPFFGVSHIAYIPRNEVLGFSKFARIVDSFARRLQLQERLTQQVADFLYESLRPEGLLLIIESLHTCALIRGVEEPMHMVTAASRGVFREKPKLRREVEEIIRSVSRYRYPYLNHYPQISP